jgi:hypothetical protein
MSASAIKNKETIMSPVQTLSKPLGHALSTAEPVPTSPNLESSLLMIVFPPIQRFVVQQAGLPSR